jgi:hypothetical protein
LAIAVEVVDVFADWPLAMGLGRVSGAGGLAVEFLHVIAEHDHRRCSVRAEFFRPYFFVSASHQRA